MTRRRLIFAGASAALGMVAALSAAEITLRVFDLGPRIFVVKDAVRLAADPELVYELVPGARSAKSGKGDDSPVNSAGFRGREYSEGKPPGTFRIAIIGDSVAYGVWIPIRETLEAVLEDLLNRPAMGGTTRYEVLNFGVSGYNSRQIARRTETTVARFQPDVVLYLYCLNDPEDPGDVSDLQRDSAMSGLRLYQLLRIGLNTMGPRPLAGPPLPPYQTEIGFYEALHADGPRWSSVQRDISRIAAAASRIDARFIGVISPHMWEQADEQRFQVEPPLSTIAAKAEAAFQATGALAFDLAPAVARYSRATGEYLALDPVHFNVTGHRFVAVALLDLLLRRKILPDAAVADADAVVATDLGLRRMLGALH